MSDQPTYTNFISAAMEFLAARPEAGVLIVVESNRGFETFRSVESPIWNLGAAKAAALQFEETLRLLFHSNNPAKDAIEKEEENRMMESVKRDKEKAN